MRMPIANSVRFWLWSVVGSAVLVAQEVTPRPVDLRTLWKFAEPDAAIDQVAAHAGVVYVAFGAGQLVALRANDGTEIWRRKLGTDRVAAIARVGVEKVEAIVVTFGEQLALLDRLTGEPKWSRRLSTGLAEPVVVGNHIVGGGGDGKLHAFSLGKGDPVWQTDYLADAPPDPPGFVGKDARIGDQKARPGPAAADGDLVVVPVFDQCRAVAVDARTGKRGANFPARGWMFMRPTFAGGFVLVAGQDQFVRCFDKVTGTEVWAFQTKGRIESSCLVRDDRVYQGSCDGHMYCLGLQTGELIWQQRLAEDPAAGVPIYEPPAIFGDILVQPALSGEIVAFDRATGKVVGSHRPEPDSEIEGSAWAGALLLVETRRTFVGKGEEAVFAIGR
ncbi:MAG: PQQ-binding-like beta-propeller repeat protein [Planctomycetes bacterium]|nr:PQQ-binding-like beta-propeller repeat protein [Planctomycetota bacterium]